MRSGFRSMRQGFTGKIADIDPRFTVESFNDSIRPLGLFVWVDSGDSANVRVSCGADGSEAVERTVTVGSGGTWFSCVGWGRVAVFVDTVSGNDVSVSGAWIAEQSDGRTARFVGLLDSTGQAVPVPNGAKRVAVSAAPAGFVWRSAPYGAILDIVPVFPNPGVFADVCGTHYVNNVGNTVACWEIETV